MSVARVEVGRLGAAHGVRGWLRVQSFTDPPQRLFEWKHWFIRDREMRVIEARPQGKDWIVLLEGVVERDAASLLTGQMVLVDRESLPPTGDREYYREDLVGFVIGCSFSFEQALMDAGMRLRHVDEGRNVAMYRTSLATTPAGPFAGPMVVSMRPLKTADAARAVAITSRFPDVHGAPVHVGDPAAIGAAASGKISAREAASNVTTDTVGGLLSGSTAGIGAGAATLALRSLGAGGLVLSIGAAAAGAIGGIGGSKLYEATGLRNRVFNAAKAFLG